MVAPTIRRITRAAPGALNAFAFATDDQTLLTFLRLSGANQIIDMVNDPDPAAGLLYTIQLWKNTKDTGKRFFSSSMSAASAGRVNIGPIDIMPGDLQFNVAQTLGALTAQSWIIKFLRDP